MTLSLSGSSLTLVDPATGEAFDEVPQTTAPELEAAVRDAEAAQRLWRSMTGDQRATAMWRWAELVERHHPELAELDVRCTGKTIRDATAEAARAARHLRHWAGRADGIFGQSMTDVPGRLSYTVREPLGVYAVVLPANAPTHAFAARVAPPLACGNAVIVKPAEISPLSARRLAELAREAGLPEHLVTVLPGDGGVGSALVSHPGVSGISFTGSIRTGRAIAAGTSADFKKSIYELGGKSPVVVFGDADLDAAASGVAAGILANAGQICAAGSRLIVHADVADELCSRLRAIFDDMTVGDPMDPATDMGPVACRAQWDRVVGMIDRGVAAGARPIGRHGAQDRPGFFVEPTLLQDVTGAMEVWQEEVFGPVLAVRVFSEEQDAIRLANETVYGLAAYVWTTEVGRMLRVTAAIDAGVVHGNTALVMDSALPFGGFKSSGLGGAYGLDAIEAATRTKRVTLAFS